MELMTDHQVRLLLDLAWDVGARVDNEHVVQWARLNRQSPLDIGFLIRITEKFGHILIIPKRLPLYAKEFLVFCKHEKDRWGQFEESPRNLADVELRREVQQLRWLAGLSTREDRYVDQLWGIIPFTPLRQFELAKQERLTPPAIKKRLNSIERRMLLAGYLSGLGPVERLYVLNRREPIHLGVPTH